MAKIPPASPGAVPPAGAAFAARTGSTSGPKSFDAGGILRRAAADGVLQELVQVLLDEGGYLPGGTTPPVVTLPTMTISPASRTVTEGVLSAGDLLATATLTGPLPSDVTPTVTPNDGRVVLSGVGSNNTFTVRVGLTASGVGSTTYTIGYAKDGATNTPQQLPFGLTVQAVAPPVVAHPLDGLTALPPGYAPFYRLHEDTSVSSTIMRGDGGPTMEVAPADDFFGTAALKTFFETGTLGTITKGGVAYTYNQSAPVRCTRIARQAATSSEDMVFSYAAAPLVVRDPQGRYCIMADTSAVIGRAANYFPVDGWAKLLVSAVVTVPSDAPQGSIIATMAPVGFNWAGSGASIEHDRNSTDAWRMLAVQEAGLLKSVRNYGYSLGKSFAIVNGAPQVVQIGRKDDNLPYARVNGLEATFGNTTEVDQSNISTDLGPTVAQDLHLFGNPNGRRATGVVLYALCSTTNGAQIAKLAERWGGILATAADLDTPDTEVPIDPEPEIPSEIQDPDFDYRNYERPVVGSGGSGIVWAPSVMSYTASGAVQGFNFTCSRAVPQCYNRFAVLLERGKLMPGQYLEYVLEGSNSPVPVQFTPLKLWDDGSVCHARIYCLHPALTAGQTIRALLRTTTTAPGAILDHSGLASQPITGTWSVKGTYTSSKSGEANGFTQRSWSLDIGAANIATGTASPWYSRGAICAERRYVLDFQQGLRFYVDALRFVDDTWQFQCFFGADKVIFSNPDKVCSWLCDLTMAQGGTNILNSQDLRIGLCQIEPKIIHTGRTAAVNVQRNPPDHAIQIDAPLYSQMTFFPTYAYDKGVTTTFLATNNDRINDARFRGPLSPLGCPLNIGGAGGAPTIGYVPQASATWCITQDAKAREIMISDGYLSGIIPWNNYDPTKNITFNNFPDIGYPGLWIDARGGSNPANTNYVDAFHGWTVDFAHQPNLANIAYLVTGDRYFMERMMSQGANAIAYMYPPSRTSYISGGPDWVFMQNAQNREAGWCARDVGVAIKCLPDGNLLLPWLRQAADYNFQVLFDRIPAWTVAAGQPHGWLPNAGPGKNNMRAWENDHICCGVAACYFADVRGAKEYLAWAKNWFIGRKFQDDAVFPWKLADCFEFIMGNIHNIVENPPTTNTWAKLRENADMRGIDSSGFPNNGNYQQLSLRSDAMYGTIFNDPQAAVSIARNEAQGAPFVDLATYRREPLDAIRPLIWKT